MEALCPFEIKKNIIGVYWQFDDAENDETITDEDEYNENHSNDGLFIYEIKNNKIEEIKILKKIDPTNYHSFTYLKNSLIMKYYINYKKHILSLDRNNLQVINKLDFVDDSTKSCDISPFDSHLFIVAFWKKNEPIKFIIYDNKTLKKVYESETEEKYFFLKKMLIVGIFLYVN